MDKKRLLVVIISAILIGEVLYLIFLNMIQQKSQNEVQKELFTAIIEARVSKLLNIRTNDEESANIFKNYCKIQKIVNEYTIYCEEDIENLSIDEEIQKVSFTYLVNVEKVFTKIKSQNFSQTFEFSLPYYIKKNKKIVFDGLAVLVNDSIYEVKPEKLRITNVSKNETVKIKNAKPISYIYIIPFDNRSLIKNDSTVFDVVYTNMSSIVRGGFVKDVGEGYIIVDRNVKSETIKALYQDAVINDVKYESEEKIDEFEGLFNYSVKYLIDLETSVGSIKTVYTTNKKIKENDELNATLNLVMSGDLILKKDIIIHEFEG